MLDTDNLREEHAAGSLCGAMQRAQRTWRLLGPCATSGSHPAVPCECPPFDAAWQTAGPTRGRSWDDQCAAWRELVVVVVVVVVVVCACVQNNNEITRGSGGLGGAWGTRQP
jgi:hypothetical protein